MTEHGAHGERPLVLIVDDDQTTLLLERQALEQDGFTVTEAGDGVEALVAFDHSTPDIVLLDVNMPRMDGFAVCAALRGSPGGEQVPIMMVTAMDDVESINRAYDAGATDFVTKPLNWALLGYRIRYLLRGTRLQQELREREEEYRTLFENLQDIFYRTDLDGNIVLASPSVEARLGYSPDELKGRNLAADLYVDPDKREDFLREIHEKGHVEGHLIDLKTKDGSVVWMSTNAQLYRDSEGRVLGVEGMTRDVTRETELEKHLRESQKLEALGTLAGGIAHDFNNLLTPIIGYTEMALTEVSEATPANGWLERVISAGERAKDLIRQILTFSRQGDPERELVQLASLVHEALALLRGSLPATLEIRHSLDGESCPILADPSQIHQLLVNLLTNASHAIGDQTGTLEVRLETAAVQDELPDLPSGPYAVLTVEDTGRGIPPDVVERIFDPFFTTKSVGEGTGLGLAVVHGIVRGHGGAIEVDSTPGVGTTFRVYFPLARGDETPDFEGDKIDVRGTERILVVDDEKTVLDVLRESLEFLGYCVVTAQSGRQALEVFRARPDEIDVVVTDYTMPQMVGTELAGELRQLRPDVPIVLCTGFHPAVTPETVAPLGIRELVMKPLRAQEIGRAVRRALEEY